MVEHQLPKLRVAGSNPVSRSSIFVEIAILTKAPSIGFSSIFLSCPEYVRRTVQTSIAIRDLRILLSRQQFYNVCISVLASIIDRLMAINIPSFVIDPMLHQ